MSQFSKGFFGLLAVTATFGVIQFASGNDLGRTTSETRRGEAGIPINQSVVNRAAKADRAALVNSPAVSGTTTLSFQTNSVAGTSVLLRLPADSTRIETVNSGPAAVLIRPAPGHKSPFACEPVVSVLTEIAKHLPPGRCVT